tara:strand:+ start:4730 stop:5311 length:582 start_codon:yes stop_codon:yes gene_type:complete
MNILVSQKQDLRKILTQKREKIKQNAEVEFNQSVFDQLRECIDFEKINDVASFISIRSEISTYQLNNKIIKLGKNLSFPVIVKNSDQLTFKIVNSNDSFKLGKFNIPEPINDNQDIIPQLFFVPCLAFDLKGFRLGYGGGFYDRTFAKFKKLNLKFYSVGFAFDDQKQNTLPREIFDYKLDFVLTEKQLYKFL